MKKTERKSTPTPPTSVSPVWPDLVADGSSTGGLMLLVSSIAPLLLSLSLSEAMHWSGNQREST